MRDTYAGDGAEAYFEEIRPMLGEAYQAAYCVSGDAGRAEDALGRAVTACWREKHKGSLRGKIRGEAIREALSLADADGDDWVMPPVSGRLAEILEREPPRVRRAIALRYGCGLGSETCAGILGESAQRLRAARKRFERAAEEVFPRETEENVTRAIRQAFSDAACPDAASIGRRFLAEVAEDGSPVRASRVLPRVLCAACCLLLIAAFWVVTALLGTPAQHAGTESVETESVETESMGN